MGGGPAAVTEEAPRDGPMQLPHEVRPRWRMTTGRWLVVAVVAYFAISFSLSWLRAIELQTTTWDQGLYQQAIWMSAHGRPFYETADVETGGFGSLLDVHSVFVLYLVVPLYAVFPYESTLFAVQSAVVALAAVPLFLLARDVTRSPRLGLVAALAFLCWTPTLSSNLYDFHPEAFLPLEMFALLLLWERERYLAGFAAAAIAFLTFEFAPAIVFTVGVFALLPSSLSLARWHVVRSSLPRHRGRAFVRWLSTPKVRASLILMAASVVAYAGLWWLRVDVLPTLLGMYPLPVAATGYVIGSTPAALGLSVANLPVGFGAKVVYWVVILALLAFVPLLSPRALVLSAPWFAFTLLSSNLNYSTLGFQYGFIAGSTLLVAFAYGLPVAQRIVAALRSGADANPSGPAAGPFLPALRWASFRRTTWVGVAALLAVNIALTPVNPAMQDQGLGSAYRLSLDPPPSDSGVFKLAALIPPGATVLATDDLFPLVANDANAYSFLWVSDPGLALPFNLGNPPTYVFLSEDRTSAVSSWLTGALYNTTLYGVRGVVWSSTEGTVLLFETGYRGPVAEFGDPPSSQSTFYGSAVGPGSAGFSTTVGGSTYPSVVQSLPGQLGTVWYGPGVALGRGNYTVTVSLRLSSVPGFPAPGASVPSIWIGALAFAQPTFYGWTFDYGALNRTAFSTISIPVDVPAPTIEFVVEGVLLESGAQVTLNYLAIGPAEESGS